MLVLLIKGPVWLDASMNEESPSIINEHWK